MEVKDLIKQMITGLAAGTDDGRAAAEEAGHQVVLAKSAEVLANSRTTDPVTPEQE